MGHSESCLKRMREALEDQRRWEKHNPNHCKACRGCGGTWHEGEAANPGDSSVRTDGWSEPCPECVGRGICPTCGVAKRWPCYACGFDPATDLPCGPDADQLCTCRYEG